jgi:hypothetical protein
MVIFRSYYRVIIRHMWHDTALYVTLLGMLPRSIYPDLSEQHLHFLIPVNMSSPPSDLYVKVNYIICHSANCRLWLVRSFPTTGYRNVSALFLDTTRQPTPERLWFDGNRDNVHLFKDFPSITFLNTNWSGLKN